jgi:hypothetical protein
MKDANDCCIDQASSLNEAIKDGQMALDESRTAIQDLSSRYIRAT